MTDNEPADPDAILKGTHRWVIPNWRKVEQRKLVSENFFAGGSAWQMKVYPRGYKDTHKHVWVNLFVIDTDTLPDGWERLASFGFTVEGAAKSNDEDEATIKA
jgi:hypothetical protein